VTRRSKAAPSRDVLAHSGGIIDTPGGMWMRLGRAARLGIARVPAVTRGKSLRLAT
jgi:hypothetical protein